MRAVVTRVISAGVECGGVELGKIETGFLVLLAVKSTDTPVHAELLARKICQMRVFGDENGKMNLSLADVSGSLLVVSQFTLYASCKKGRRPDFFAAAGPQTAIPLYEHFIALCRGQGFNTQTGAFGADMRVHSVIDGPVTIILDTDDL